MKPRAITDLFEPADMELLTTEFEGLSMLTRVEMEPPGRSFPTAIHGDDDTAYALTFYRYDHRFTYWKRVWLAYVREIDTLLVAKGR